MRMWTAEAGLGPPPGLFSASLVLTHYAGMPQLEEIALDPEAEGGKGSIGSTAALKFTQTQATQASQGTQTQGPKARSAAEPQHVSCLDLDTCACAFP